MSNESISSNNSKEEIKDLLLGFDITGLSKSLDPVYKILKEETVSPRGQLLNLQAGIYSPELLFASTLCMGAEETSLIKTPYTKIIRKARSVIVEEGKMIITPELKPIIEEIKNYVKNDNTEK